MTDTECLDLLVKLLERHDLYKCNQGYTFFPKNAKHFALVEDFFPTVRALLDAVKEKL